MICKFIRQCSTQLFGEKDVEKKCSHFRPSPKRKPVIKKTYRGFVKYDKNGKQYTNWVQSLKKKSRRYLKKKCERCPETKKGVESIEELKARIMDEKNCITLCLKCHRREHDHEPTRTI